ncbi:nicotinamidase [Rhodoblastus acidophilus]|uniref:nicotinamidase n=1 Tax=Candidatus Rhodoblastus alkanivorans TaxID=2954117 RepID=A0ABS9Z6X7_9HYPH|nr:nicotinamidase [Candidatus Rhodoblastus alkanivorans]MCI4679600.1 nicotinamidase [Candidatus Rhodoblastus alkanivorans]MCI4683425.1 nicotinamidase [Candidatus Rhodoblastus alkanivorans]MDI4640735.1 nicotinamidase [Rhodoblastus acidophilus]
MSGGNHIGQGDVLLIVDVQNDFCPGGALPIAGGDAILPRVNALIDEATRAGALVVASRDWHPADHVSFAARGGPWPRHCLQDESGAAFHRDLKLPASTMIVTKGDRLDSDQYSAFDRTGLADELRRRKARRVWVCGLALDVCVKATALDSVAAGFPTLLVTSATAPVTAEDGADALDELARAGVQFVA